MQTTKTIPPEWNLNRNQLRQIFNVEKELAAKLKSALAAERRQLYATVYEEYFQKLPFHPQFTVKHSPELQKKRVDFQLRQIHPFSGSEKTFMEIGAGDCSLSIAASRQFKMVYAMEVSAGIIANIEFPKNITPILFDGFNIPLENESIDLAYSNQLMEHLHPDDAEDQLRSIHRVLKKNGTYVCITPNRISGPNDISRFFTDKAVGFHLKEYSAGDLRKIFKRTGFSKMVSYNFIKGRKINIPFTVTRIVEAIAEALPSKIRTAFLRLKPVSIVFYSCIAAIK